MRRLYIILAVIVLSTVSCNEHSTIPKKKLARIYYDMYMTDEAVSQNRNLRLMTDSLHLYEPIFNKYGYTTDDYLYTVDLYLENPEKFMKIFENTKELLLAKQVELEKIITYETRFDRLARWKMLDSLDAIVASEGPGKSYFKFAKFFFDQLEAEPIKDTRRFSLIVDRPDLDSAKADTTAADTLSIASAVYDSIYRFVLRPVMAYTDTTDSIAADTYLFVREPAYGIIIDTAMVSDTVDIISPEDTVKKAKVIEHYGSSIVKFILIDQAFQENFLYVLQPNEIDLSAVNRTDALDLSSRSQKTRRENDMNPKRPKVDFPLDQSQKTLDNPTPKRNLYPDGNKDRNLKSRNNKESDRVPEYRRRPDTKDSTYRRRPDERDRKDPSYRQRPDERDRKDPSYRQKPDGRDRNNPNQRPQTEERKRQDKRGPEYKPEQSTKMTPEQIKKLQQERQKRQKTNPKSAPKDTLKK